MRARILLPLCGIALLSLLVRSTPGRADDATGTGFCPPCPNGTTDIGLSVVTSQIDDDWRFRWAVGRWYDAPAGLPMTGPLIADSPEKLQSLVRETAAQCKRIKFLAIDSHGDLGYLSFGDSGLSVLNIDTALWGMDCAMAPDARIALSGCNVGRGCRGEDFLEAMASHLLTKGGSVHAATDYDISIPLVAPGFSMNFRYQTLTVTPGLASHSWERDPQTVQQCRQRVSDALADVAAIRERTAGCRQVDQGNGSFLDRVEQKLRAADGAQAVIDGARDGFDGTRAEAAKVFFSAFVDYYQLKRMLDSIGPCDENGDQILPPVPAL